MSIRSLLFNESNVSGIQGKSTWRLARWRGELVVDEVLWFEDK